MISWKTSDPKTFGFERAPVSSFLSILFSCIHLVLIFVALYKLIWLLHINNASDENKGFHLNNYFLLRSTGFSS
jgi:hypothetical protein